MSGPVHCVVIIIYMADAPRIVWGALTFSVLARCAGRIPELGAEGKLGAEGESVFHGIPLRVPGQEQNPRSGLARALQGGLSFLPRNKIPSLWEVAD